jgi:hypothetical protein
VIQATLQDGYDEACRALGEAVVSQRLMAKAAADEIAQLTAELDELRRVADPPIEE